jgi:hypothetical protein
MTNFSAFKSALLPMLVAASLSAAAQNVGIGTTSPTQPLDVNGNVRIRGLSGTEPRLLQGDATGTLSTAPTSYPAAATLNPVLNSSTTGLNNPLVAVSGTLAVVLNRGAGTLSLYDVSNPAALVLRGTYSGLSTALEVAISGTTAVVLTNLDNGGGVIGNAKVFTLGSGAPALVATLVPPAALSGNNGGITMSGNKLYAVYDRPGGTGYLYAYDLTTPASPTLLGTGSGAGGCFTPQAMATAGSFLAVSSMYGGVSIINVSNPAAPAVVSSTGCAGYNGGYDVPVAMTTSTLTSLTISTATLNTYNVSGTGILSLRHSYNTGANPVSVALSGNLAYVACRGTNTLQVIDVSGATAVLRGSVALDASTNNIALGSSLVLAANATANSLQAFSSSYVRSVTVALDGSISTAPLPTPNDYLQNQTALVQSGGFSVSGSGNVGGSVGIGLSAATPVTRLHVKASGTGLPNASGTSQGAGHYARLADNSTLVLDLGGNGAGGNWLQSTNSSNLALTYPLLLNPNGGNVGIGLTAAGNRLDVQTSVRSGTHATGRALYVSGDFGAADTGVEFRHTNGSQGVGIGYNSIYAAGTNANQDLNLMPKGTGFVGIGTTGPSKTLDVNGTARVRTLPATGTLMVTADASGNLGAATLPTSESTTASSGLTRVGTDLRLGGALAGATTVALGNNNLSFSSSGGNVGIGTSAAPTARLEVAGQVKITGGTPGAGKVLTSDVDGLATWESPTTPAITVLGTQSLTMPGVDGTTTPAASVLILTDNASPINGVLTLGSGSNGQLLLITNVDAEAVSIVSASGTGSIAAGFATQFVYTGSGATGGWRRIN